MYQSESCRLNIGGCCCYTVCKCNVSAVNALVSLQGVRVAEAGVFPGSLVNIYQQQNRVPQARREQ